jgi:hypothetical protein
VRTTLGGAYAALPPQPFNFYGMVKVGGAIVVVGAAIAVWRENTLIAQVTTQMYPRESVYSVQVPGDDLDTPAVKGGVAGGTLGFRSTDK